MKGESDHEGLVTIAPPEDPEELDDSVDLLFTDITDWSVVDPKGQSPYRYNERELVRAWAENCPATRQFLMDNLCPVRADQRHAWRRRFVAREGGALLPQAGQ